MNSDALIIIAKYPEIESVKTRLKGHIPDNERLELYIHLLNITVQKLCSIPGVDTFIAFAPADKTEYFKKFKQRLIPLRTTDLGEGMYEAFKSVFNSGYQRAALVGADIPELSVSVINDAMEVLSLKDLVYGPAKDGGYYLIGMSRLIKEVFHNIQWSSEQTLTMSLIQAELHGYSSGFTKTLSDIDTINDIKEASLNDAGYGFLHAMK